MFPNEVACHRQILALANLEVLARGAVRDFDAYAVSPGGRLLPDLFLD